jgi:5-carboxymethyl-2-hydroxymuconate isomerase
LNGVAITEVIAETAAVVKAKRKVRLSFSATSITHISTKTFWIQINSLQVYNFIGSKSVWPHVNAKR